MNILIPHTWLLEHLETKAKPEEIQKYLSLSGPSVERIELKAGEPVYDIEVTTNRVDMMSVRGIAREAAVILTQSGLPSRLKPLTLPTLDQLKPQIEALPLPQIINDPQLCGRITCIVLAGVKRAQTPDWMSQRLLQVEMNVHDSAIDITNYITHDLGHPCHAFDYDKLMASGGEIRVVQAKAGQSFTTLDGVNFTTVGGEVVFADASGQIIDLPSIKGTANTSIDASTKNILLLMESINSDKVRFASMTHAIRTVAAQLMEKNTDPYLIDLVLPAGVGLYQQLCQAEIGSAVWDEFPVDKKLPIIKFELKQLQRYLGLDLPTDEVVTILESLGCQVSRDNHDVLHVQPPTSRHDLEISADIVEEIARIYGYHKIPSRMLDTALPLSKPTDTKFWAEAKIKTLLANLGWHELYTYSMVSQEIAVQSGLDLATHLKIQNPLTDDRVYLRRSLLPSLWEVYGGTQWQDVRGVFELAYSYAPAENQLPDQQLHLALVTRLPYRQLRSDLETALDQLHVGKVAIEPTDQLQNQGLLVLLVKNQKIQFGSVTQIQAGVFGVDVEWSKLVPYMSSYPTYQPEPVTNKIEEEMTFELPARTPIGRVMETIYATSKLVVNVQMLTEFNQRVSFAITYQDAHDNLTSDQLVPIRKNIVDQVKSEFKVDFIGQLIEK